MSFTSLILSLLLCVVPLAFVVGAFWPQGLARWRVSAAVVAVLAALLAGAGHVFLPNASVAPWLSSAPVSLVLLLLIAVMGTVISRYSLHYLAGEPREQQYYKSLFATLAAASLAVISNHMLLLLAAWVAISLCLHHLLMFYPERPRAALAAHKKFLLARVAELSLLAAIVLLYMEHGTFLINEVVATYSQNSLQQLSLFEQSAALLLALTALIKCAQLPVHGWLIQVVESPTPVSALLHAGIINLGGYLLILFAPLLSQALFAQWLILVVAGLTTLLAGLIMLTRVSVKVRLAWSTTAQMGLMLVECALGLYELALLHLVAHSCYKAHAFLNSGSAVEYHLYRQMAPSQAPVLGRWALAVMIAVLLISPAFVLLVGDGPYSPWLLLTAMVTLLLAQRSRHFVVPQLFSIAVFSAVLVAAYSVQKTGASWLVGDVVITANPMADLWFGFLIALLLGGAWLLTYATHTAMGKRLWNAMFAGLYLDEWSTRVTLAIWPKRLPSPMNAKHLPQPFLNKEPLL